VAPLIAVLFFAVSAILLASAPVEDDRAVARTDTPVGYVLDGQALAALAEVETPLLTAETAPETSTAQSIESRLANWPGGIVRGPDGQVASVFGFTPQATEKVLVPVTKQRALERDSRPDDLVYLANGIGGAVARAVVVPDLDALVAAAREDGVGLRVMSGFRSYAAQSTLFEQRVRERLAVSGWTLTVDEARERANYGTALPGYSQHQLGTALDFSTPEIGYRLGPAFAATSASVWLNEHAADFGFILPYTELGRERTGYIPEPWHLRWVGKELATFLMSERYLENDTIVADDYIEALDRLLTATSPADN